MSEVKPELGIICDEMRDLIQYLLEQDFGNVSIAIFSRPTESFEPIVELADISIRLLKVEAPPSSLRGYTQRKIKEYIEPNLVAAGYNRPGAWFTDIEHSFVAASDGLWVYWKVWV